MYFAVIEDVIFIRIFDLYKNHGIRFVSHNMKPGRL